jgi:nuclear GTP-binding protein
MWLKFLGLQKNYSARLFLSCPEQLSSPNQNFLRIAHQQLKMGTGKKEASRKVRQGKVGDGMANVKVKGENFYR